MLTKTLLTLSLLAETIVLSNSPSYHIDNTKTNYHRTITQLTTPTQTEYTGIVKKVDNIAEQITVRIATADIPSYGSGVIIAREGDTYYVATARHVVEDRKQYQIITSDGETHELDNQTIEESDAYDFAIFSFTSNNDYTVATIGDYIVGANRKQLVFVSGFPKNKSPQRIITGGKVREQEKTSFSTKDSYSLQDIGSGLLYSNISYKGMSGGAVLDSEGKLIGINTGAENELYSNKSGNYEELSLGLSLGIPIRDIFSFIERETPLKTSSLQTTKDSSAEVSNEEYASIETQLLIVEQPEDDTNLVAWMNHGNQLWRYERYSEAIEAFEKVIAINPNFDRAYYLIGLAYWYQQDYSQAATALEKATQINSNPYFYWRYLGYSYGELYQFDEAISAYERAIAQNPQDFILYVEQGNVLRNAGRYKEALASYNEAVFLNPNHNWIYNNRGIIYDELGKNELALFDYNRAIQLTPNDSSAYLKRAVLYMGLGKSELALSDYNRAIELNHKDDLAYYNRAILYDEQGKTELALADYSKAIRLNHSNIDAYNNRAIIYSEQEKYNLALADYNQIIELAPNDFLAYSNRGLLYQKLEEYDLALSDLDKAFQLAPKAAFTYFNPGIQYKELEEAQLALAEYNKAIQLNVNDAEAYYNRGIIYTQQAELAQAQVLANLNQQIESSSNNFETLDQAKTVYEQAQDYDPFEQDDLAIAEYNQAIEINPNYAMAYSNRGIVYARRANAYVDALTEYESGIQLNSDAAMASHNRGTPYQQGQNDIITFLFGLALADFNHAVKLEPNNAIAYNNRGVLYQKARPNLPPFDYERSVQLELAIADFNQAIKLEPDNAMAYNNRGAVYYEQEQTKLAISNYEQAIQLNPNYAEAYANLGLVYMQLEKTEKARTNLQKAQQLFNSQNNLALKTLISLFLERLP